VRSAGSSSRFWLHLALWFRKVPSSIPVGTFAALDNESYYRTGPRSKAPQCWRSDARNVTVGSGE
jgi:hypothetical protein